MSRQLRTRAGAPTMVTAPSRRQMEDSYGAYNAYIDHPLAR